MAGIVGRIVLGGPTLVRFIDFITLLAHVQKSRRC
jgi:hypothetical protein